MATCRRTATNAITHNLTDYSNYKLLLKWILSTICDKWILWHFQSTTTIIIINISNFCFIFNNNTPSLPPFIPSIAKLNDLRRYTISKKQKRYKWMLSIRNYFRKDVRNINVFKCYIQRQENVLFVWQKIFTLNRVTSLKKFRRMQKHERTTTDNSS